MGFFRGDGDVDSGALAGMVLKSQNNLSDVLDVNTARTNLGIGSTDGAANVGFSPTGTVSSNNVQAAIAEVASESLQKTSNLSDIANASTARTNLGLGTIATQNANNVAITGGSVSGITDIAVADGGTGASDAATARTNLGLGSISTQSASNVSITGGSITGITDIAVADGGTGASNAADARSNLGASASGANSDITSLSALASINGGQIAGMRNKLINGAFGVDQRNAGASQTITAGAALAYTVDRWYAYCTGANVTGQRVAGTAPNQYNYRFTGAASVTKIGFAQRIEATDCQDLAGQTATLSVDLANSLLTTVTWTAWYANTADTFGTLASPTRTQIATGTFTVNSTLTRYNARISVPSAATTGIEVEFSVGAQTSGTWTIGRAQFEVGSVATSFEHRPIGTELALCQRYYAIVDTRMAGYTAAGVANQYAGQLAFQMRVTPSVVIASSSNNNTTDANVVARGASHYLHNSVGVAAGGFISEAVGNFSAEL